MVRLTSTICKVAFRADGTHPTSAIQAGGDPRCQGRSAEDLEGQAIVASVTRDGPAQSFPGRCDANREIAQ